MADDYYSVLEIPRSATQDEIQQAYRRLARKYHPDLQGDSKSAKKNFQRVQQAYDVLGDEEKRRQYDRFGPNFEQMRGSPFGGGQGGSPFGGGEIDFSQIFGGQPGDGGGAGPGGLEEMLRQWGLGGGPRGRSRQAGPVPTPGQQPPESDLEQQITVPFATAVLGGQYQVTVDRESGKS
jgi:DnaJ-class molecular chaperone